MGTNRREPGLKSAQGNDRFTEKRAACEYHEGGGLGQAAAVLTETKHEVGIADQPRRGVGRDAKLLGIYPNVYRWPQEGRVAQEGVQGARDQNQSLLGVAPLQRVVGVLRRDGEECLAIARVVALCRPEVDRPRDVFFMGVAGSPVSLCIWS